MRISFDKVDGFTRYLVWFGPEKCDAIYNKIRYLISQKIGITYVISQIYTRIKIDSHDFLPPEKISTLHNVITLIKSIFNKGHSHYYYNIFVEKCSYQLAQK